MVGLVRTEPYLHDEAVAVSNPVWWDWYLYELELVMLGVAVSNPVWWDWYLCCRVRYPMPVRFLIQYGGIGTQRGIYRP